MTRHSLSLILAQVLLLSCSSAPPEPTPPPPPPPTIVNLEIKSAADVNPDTGGTASPVMFRIYELRETSGFTSADFFSLFDKDQATLLSDAVRKQELLIKPNDSKTLSIQPDPATRALGFFVAFRQLDTAQWRALMPITAQQTQSAVINLKGNQLVLEPPKIEQ